MNKHGLCVIKLIIDLTTSENLKKRMVIGLLPELIKLVSDPFGNYALSRIIEKWQADFCQPIFEALCFKISELSMQKYSSCVIEQCLIFGSR